MLEPASLTVDHATPTDKLVTHEVAGPTPIASALRRFGIAALVATYLGAVLLGPLLAMGLELGRVGVGEALRALATPQALFAIKTTLVLSSIAVVVNAIVGTLGAIAVVRHRFLGRAVVDALADLPLAVSPVMIGLAFILLFGREGWLAALPAALGVKVVFAWTGLLVATLFVSLPFTLREVAYVLEEIGTSEEEAAATLGAGPWQTFFRVTLPNIRFALGYGLLMTLARSLGEFGAVLVLGGSISGHTQTATTFIHAAIEERQTAAAYGMAVVLALTSIVLLLALEWAKRRKKVR